MTHFLNPLSTNQPMSAIQEFAESVAKQVGFDRTSSIEALVGRLGGRIRYLSEWDSFSDSSNSLVVNGPKDFEITVSSLSGPLRNRFTIAHELAHYFLHSNMGKRKIRALRRDSDRVEWEANWFAGAFLMPQAEFETVCKRHKSASTRVAKAAAHFGVSLAAAEVRMKALGLVKEK